MQRLDKILSEAGIASRKELKGMIKAGRISVNGETVFCPDQKWEETACRICVDGMPIRQKRTVVLMLHKPAGYVTSTEDPRDKTVMDLLPAEYQNLGISPVGRLDKETEGLLLLTNDGELAHQIISPKRHISKVYVARHEGQAGDADVASFRNGLTLRDGTVCQPAILEPLGVGKSRIILHEGKYHQVRRMMASRGMHVTYLKRVAEGGLELGTLEAGKCRELSPSEIDVLRN